MNLEDYFISNFNIKNSFIGDDGALINGYVYSKDAFFEDIHFKRSWMSLNDIASKAMTINISDAVAMNAKPLYALLCVAMPKDITKAQAKKLASGFILVAKKYGVKIIGGDTISNTKLDITVTIISKTKKPLFRKGMKNNHLLAYTGKIGDSKKELKKLLNGGKIDKQSKFKNIILRDKFISKTQKYLSAGLDISDGIFSDLGKLSTINHLGFKFLQHIPKDIGCSGEEYEMLIAFSQRNKKAVLRRAKQTRTPLTIFAKAKRKRYTNRCKANHF